MSNKPSTINGCFATIYVQVQWAVPQVGRKTSPVRSLSTLHQPSVYADRFAVHFYFPLALCILWFRRTRTVSYKTVSLFLLPHFLSVSNRSETWPNLLITKFQSTRSLCCRWQIFNGSVYLLNPSERSRIFYMGDQSYAVVLLRQATAEGQTLCQWDVNAYRRVRSARKKCAATKAGCSIHKFNVLMYISLLRSYSLEREGLCLTGHIIMNSHTVYFRTQTFSKSFLFVFN